MIEFGVGFITRLLLPKILPRVVIWFATLLGQQLLIKYIHQHILKDEKK